MATKNGKSGKFNIYTENQYISGYVAWQETYDDSTYISTNKSKVTIEAYLHRTNIYADSTSINASGTRKAYFGSETVEDNSTLNFSIAGNTNSSGGAYTKVFTASKEITHNSDGNKTLDLGFYMYNAISGAGGNAFRVPKTLSNVSLMTIPRYGTCNHSLSSKTENRVRINWSSDNTVDYLWYSKDNGSTWTGVDVTDSKSGTYEITDLSAYTTYNIKTRIRRKDSQLTTTSSSLSVTTYEYPHCTSTPNFVIGEGLTLKFYNPLSRLITVKFIGADGETLASDTTSQTQLSGYNTDSFNSKLYASIPNSKSGTYKIRVEYNSNVKIRDNKNTYSIKESECTPTFNNFAYKDTNTNVTNVTGNDQVLVKGKSNLQVIISSANKMIPQKSAGTGKYIATINDISKTVYYSDSDIYLNMGAINDSGNKRLNVTAYDSRIIPKTVYKDITVYDYAKPVINVDVARLNNFEAQTTLKVNGTFTKLNIGGTDKNSITSVQYRYRETGGNWSNWTNLTTTVTNGNFTCSDIILSLDITKSFEFEIQAVDKLDSNSISVPLGVGQAIFFISTNKKACYINGKQVMTGLAQDVNRTDLNDYINEFVAGYGHNLTNSPVASLNLGHFISIPRHDAEGFVTQLFSPYTTDDLYIRKCEESSWRTWQKIVPKNILCAYLSASATVTTGSDQRAKIPFDNYEVVGDKLSFDSSRKVIIIGKGVSKISIKASICYTHDSSLGNAGINLMKNGASLTARLYSSYGTTRTYANMDIYVPCLSVAEGDIIHLTIRSVAKTNYSIALDWGIGATNLTVEALE